MGNRRSERLLAELAVLATVGPAFLASWVWLLATEGAATRRDDLVEGLRVMLGPGKALRGMPRFRRRDFHPNKRDTAALEKQWREQLFGTKGTPNGQLRRPVA